MDGALSVVAGVVSDMAAARSELQAVQLALALMLGVALGFWYDIYRVWFRRCRGRMLRGAGDILWWLSVLILSVVALYHINGIELRVPVLLLVAGGLSLYMGLLSPVLFPLLQNVARLVWRSVLWLTGRVWHIGGGVLRLLAMPVVLAADGVLWVWGVFLVVIRGVFRVVFFAPVGLVYKIFDKIFNKFFDKIFDKIFGRFGVWLRCVGRTARAAEGADKKAAKEVDFSKENDI